MVLQTTAPMGLSGFTYCDPSREQRKETCDETLAVEVEKLSPAEKEVFGRHLLRARGIPDMGVRGALTVDLQILRTVVAPIRIRMRVEVVTEAATCELGMVAEREMAEDIMGVSELVE